MMANANMDYTLIIDESKDYELNQSTSNQDRLRTFKRKIKLDRWKVVRLNKGPISKTALDKYDKSRSVLLLLAADTTYSPSELEDVADYVKGGGKVLITLSSYDDKGLSSNITKIIQAYGVTVNNDCVIRTNRFKYNHPKEVFMRNGVVNRGILEEAARLLDRTNVVTGEMTKDSFKSQNENSVTKRVGGLDDIKILYPFGATLAVEAPSMVAMTSSKFSFPVNQAICSFFDDAHTDARLVVFGSTEFFHDNYIGQEQNMLLALVILEYLVNKAFKINSYDAKTAEIEDYCQIPDLNYLSEQPLPCFQDSEPVPEDVLSLVDQKLFTADSFGLPQALGAYEHLNLPHEKLTLIRPQFEMPMPKLRPATCGPILRGPPGPRLEFFDLDTEFLPIRTRLMEASGAAVMVTRGAQDEQSLDDLVLQFGCITKIPDSKMKSGRDILDFVFRRIVTFKMVDLINM